MQQFWIKVKKIYSKLKKSKNSQIYYRKPIKDINSSNVHTLQLENIKKFSCAIKNLSYFFVSWESGAIYI